MEVMHERVAGLDVHKETVVACVRIVAGGKASRECRTFETTTAGLEALLAWLTQSGCTHVAMEATGVYWKPVWNILSDGKFELILANAAHIKNVPGRKTDVNDAMWIADLAAFGLIKASFVPEEKIQELRSLMRARKQLVREQTRHIQRIQKTLEEANIKLDSVISDIMGLSGRRMIEAMIAGVRDPRKLAQLADRRIKASPKALYDALHGRLTDHHRFMLRLHLGQYDALASSIARSTAKWMRQSPGSTRRRPQARLLSRFDRAFGWHSWHSELGGDLDPCRDRNRYEPICKRWASCFLGGPVSGPERKRGQTQIVAAAQGRPLAQDAARPMRLGRRQEEGQLLQGAVQPAEKPARPQESDLCGGRLNAHGDLPHAEKWRRTQRSRGRPFRPPPSRKKQIAWLLNLPSLASTPNFNL